MWPRDFPGGASACHAQFLDSLTPHEFFETARDKKRERQQERRRQRGEARLQKWREARALAAQQFEQGMEPQVLELMAKGLSRKKAEERARASRPPTPPPPKMEDIELTSSGEDLPMYFVEPRQLFAIFSNLEEETLFLIQHNQVRAHRPAFVQLLFVASPWHVMASGNEPRTRGTGGVK